MVLSSELSSSDINLCSFYSCLNEFLSLGDVTMKNKDVHASEFFTALALLSTRTTSFASLLRALANPVPTRPPPPMIILMLISHPPICYPMYHLTHHSSRYRMSVVCLCLRFTTTIVVTVCNLTACAVRFNPIYVCSWSMHKPLAHLQHPQLLQRNNRSE